MKKLILVSLIIIGCQNNLPNPSDISMFELPSNEVLERWAEKIDTIWRYDNLSSFSFKDYVFNDEISAEEFGYGLPFPEKYIDEEKVKMLSTKWFDISWQDFYLAYTSLRDSAYYTPENLKLHQDISAYFILEFNDIYNILVDIAAARDDTKQAIRYRSIFPEYDPLINLRPEWYLKLDRFKDHPLQGTFISAEQSVTEFAQNYVRNTLKKRRGKNFNVSTTDIYRDCFYETRDQNKDYETDQLYIFQFESVADETDIGGGIEFDSGEVFINFDPITKEISLWRENLLPKRMADSGYWFLRGSECDYIDFKFSNR
tara:strand:+ start:210 stop:1154 length:945 start_codon:yes stop_codon:yes gene_type:complete